LACAAPLAEVYELLDGMVDIVCGEIESPSIAVDWRSAVQRRAISAREALKRQSRSVATTL
jgi:hypothetical protein